VNASFTPPALAVNVTAAPEVTDETVATNVALAAPDATLTAAGTVTAVLLLARFTVNPPLAAAAFSVTVQLSVPAPVIEPFAQLNPLSTGMPVPLRSTDCVVPVDESLVRVSVPLAAPATVGSNCTASVAVPFGLIVNGNDSPEIEKPVPVTVAPLTVTGAVPVELRLMLCAIALFTGSVPKAMLALLRLSVGMLVPSSSANVFA
jgi:hypothetical protein